MAAFNGMKRFAADQRRVPNNLTCSAKCPRVGHFINCCEKRGDRHRHCRRGALSAVVWLDQPTESDHETSR